MWILIAASFIALKEIRCWPNMSNVAALFTDNKMFLNFKEFEKSDELEFLVIVFNNYYFIENVIVSGFASRQFKVCAGCRFRHDVKPGFLTVINPTRLQCNKVTTKCLTGTLAFLKSLPYLQNLDHFEIEGHEANLHKFIGCFKTKYFKGLNPVADFQDCELTCSDTPFYGFYSGERCVCIRNLPMANRRLDLCWECPKKVAIFCGIKGKSVSVYSKSSVQEISEIDPSWYRDCMIHENNRCPPCGDGRIGLLCFAITCSVNNGNCGNKDCVIINHLNVEIHLCLCAEGFYADDALECQDIDECIEDKVCKYRKRICVNTYGDYRCNCSAGLYEVDELNCTDIDECETETTCDLNTTTCMNMYGDYDCVCLEGLVKVDPTFRNSSCEVQKLSVVCLLASLILTLSILSIAIIICCRRRK